MFWMQPVPGSHAGLGIGAMEKQVSAKTLDV